MNLADVVFIIVAKNIKRWMLVGCRSTPTVVVDNHLRRKLSGFGALNA